MCLDSFLSRFMGDEAAVSRAVFCCLLLVFFFGFLSFSWRVQADLRFEDEEKFADEDSAADSDLDEPIDY